eukprot:3540456-Amphidinium_carterae.1
MGPVCVSQDSLWLLAALAEWVPTCAQHFPPQTVPTYTLPPVRWAPPVWTQSLRIGEAKNPGPPHPDALASPIGGPRRYILHTDLQPSDVLRPGALLGYTRPNGWSSHRILEHHSASR